MKFVKTLLFFMVIAVAAQAQQRGLDFAVTTVLKDYFEVKNALTANNTTLARNKAEKMIWDLNNVPTKDMSGPQHSAWFEYLSRIQRAAREVSENTVIAQQRKHFLTLSNTLYGAVKNMKFNPLPLYWQYSTAADSYWISDGPAIRNPYFGIADKKNGKEGVTKEILPAVAAKK